jgi:hypothetical protein
MALGSFLSGLFHAKTKRSPSVGEAQFKPTVKDAGAIVAAYGKVLSDDQKGSLIQDEAQLPYAKEQIKAAVRVLLRITEEPKMREHLRTGYVALSSYQPLTTNQRQALSQWDSTVGHVGHASSADLRKMAQAITESGGVVQNLQEVVATEMEDLLLEFDAEARPFQ